MKDTLSSSEIEATLRRLGELLEHAGRNAAIVVVGGAALNLLGVVQRNTVDIDVIAVGKGVGQMAGRWSSSRRVYHPTSPRRSHG